MADIAKLDYSKPPPGYLVHDLNDDGWWWRVDEPEDGCTSPYETEAEAVSDAWAHYKAHNDPPGMVVEPITRGVSTYWKHRPEERPHTGIDTWMFLASARDAAWAWYDRRLQLANLGTPWPFVLTWSNEDCADEARRWWEVLRG